MDLIATITKQATDALDAYAARAAVPADQIPALRIRSSETVITLNTPGLRVAADIAKAIDVPGVNVKLNGATVYCSTDEMDARLHARVAAHNAAMRADVDEWLPGAMYNGEGI